MTPLKKGLNYLVEYPYVDRVYRDSYYYYFSSKLEKYERDCIRVSLFEGPITKSDFYSTGKKNKLNKQFLGFVVIRPLNKCIGRNIINPEALSGTKFFIRTMESAITINGLQFTARGFPHSSQTSESMTCAQTAVWELMEYFGHRYHEYNTVLPSKIRSILSSNSYERLLPASGLPMNSISLLLKEFGFGSKVYTPKEGSNPAKGLYDEEFYQALNSYIESGIPIILGIFNEDIGHAYLAIGRTWISEKELIELKPIKSDNLQLRDFDAASRNLILIDDNFTPYQKANPKNPTSYYTNPSWKGCHIYALIVPLHKKIYLESILAKQCFIQFLEVYTGANLFSLPPGRKNYLRMFLTSSRSLKIGIQKTLKHNTELKELILKTSLPKFVWVAEITSDKLVLERKCDGIALLDATQPYVKDFKPMLLAAINNKLMYSNPLKNSTFSGNLDIETLYLQPFYMFSQNLELYER